MQRSDRNRTTLTPSLVDLPKPRRSSQEVALEKKTKMEAANAKAEAKRLAVIRVTELEKGVIAWKKGSGASTPGSKQSRKRPVTTASREDVSFPIADQIRPPLNLDP